MLKQGLTWIQPMQARDLIARDGAIANTEFLADYNERANVADLLPLAQGDMTNTGAHYKDAGITLSLTTLPLRMRCVQLLD